MTRRGLSVSLALVAVALVVLSLVAHLGSTLQTLNAKTRDNASYNAPGRLTAAADGLGLDNGWVIAALQTVGPGASYAVVLPGSEAVARKEIDEITYDAVSPYMRYLLLPRLEVSPSRAQFILCYGCRERFRGVRWVWFAPPGSKIPGLKIGQRVAG